MNSATDPLQSDYVYRGSDLNKNLPENMILIYERGPNHLKKYRNVGFLKGNVKMFDDAEFRSLIDEDNRLRRVNGLEEKPVL